MALTEEQVNKIKNHLLKQLSNFPEDKKAQIKEQIESMSPTQLENFIQNNQLTHLGGKCILCSIISGRNPSFRIGEDRDNIAILEINPLSKGHSLIIPKEHDSDILNSTKELAKQTSRKLKERYNPKRIEIREIEIMEHKVLEVIPLYGNETERKQISEAVLKKLQEEINNPIQKKKEERAPKVEIFKFPPRIP